MTKETVDFVAFEQYIDHQLRDKKLLEGVKDVIVAIKTAKRELLDARAAADKAIEEKTMSLKDLKEAKDSLDKAKAKIKKTEESAHEQAASILADAQSQANQILAKAVFDADKERQEAHRLKEENKSLADKNLTLKTEHDSLQAGIEAMKAQAKAFAGA